jgi:glucokinase
MRDTILALDTGGTSIKLALVDGAGEPTAVSFHVFAEDTRGALLQTFRDALAAGRGDAERLGLRVTRIGVACPGPFDFRLGVSQMPHKWPGIRGVPLPPVMSEVFPDVPVSFLHDSTAFMLGEAFGGAALGAQNPAGVMLGTGLGYACMHDRRVCLDATLSPRVRLWRLPYRDGIAEDYVSRRAIRKRYAQKTDGAAEPPDVREIAGRAAAGEPAALSTFSETGALLGDLLQTHLSADCDLVVIGGQIARSAQLLLPSVRQALACPSCPPPTLRTRRCAASIVTVPGRMCWTFHSTNGGGSP